MATKTTKARKSEGRRFGFALIILFALLGIWWLFLTEPIILGQPYNQSVLVNTTVNITNAAPMVSNVLLDTPITLIAYDNKTVFCNATIFDWDNQTITVNATLYHEGQALANAIDDGNNHYSNTSCKRATLQNREMNYTCSFNVKYYANNNTNWRCNVTALDTRSASATNYSNTAQINPLVAIKIPQLLNYGDLMVNEISTDTLANVTNAGNRDANISVEGYGTTPGDGLAFVCDFGVIPLSYERYSNATVNATYASMNQLTGTTRMIPRFYVPQRTSEVTDSMNFTYWKVQIPTGAGGVCNGKILFTATDRGI